MFAKLVAAAGLVMLAAAVLIAPATADPTWTEYDRATCTITITPSGRTVFQVTRGALVEVHDLSNHEPITLDVNGVAWSVAVERDGQGWVTVASGEALGCGVTPPPPPPPPSTTTTVVCESQCSQVTTTTLPDVTTTTVPDVTTTTRPNEPTDDGDCPPGASMDPTGVCFADEEGG